MLWQFNSYALLLAVSGLLSGAVAVFAWHRRPVPGATYLTLIGLGAAVWSLGYAAATGFAELPIRIYLAKVQWLGIGIVPLAEFLFVVEYTGRRRWLAPRNLVLLSIIPLAGILLAWTNEAHGLIWANAQVTAQGAAFVLDLEYGLFFWLFAGYSYLLLGLSFALLLFSYLSSSYLQRRQNTVILVALLVPWIGNVMYLTGWNPLPFLDWTPFAYSLSGLLLAWGLFRYRLLDIVPIARAAVIESMQDGILVLDEQRRIEDANPAALKMLGQRLSDMAGQSADQILTAALGAPGSLEQLFNTHDAAAGSPSQLTVGMGDSQRWYSLRISALAGLRDEPQGFLITLHDTTERQRAEAVLLQSQRLLIKQNAELRKLTQAIEQSANAVVITDREGRIEYVNPKFVEISGYTADDVLGQNPRILKSGAQDAAFYERLWQTIVSGREWRGEFQNRRKDGSIYWEQASIAPVYDASGQIRHFVAVKEDVSARKEAEEAQQRYAERLKTLSEIGQSILAARLPETVALSAIRHIRRLVACQRVMVLAVQEGGMLEMLAAESGNELGPPPEATAYRELLQERILNDGWVQGVADLNALEQLSPLQQTLQAAGTRSYVIAPLRVEGELVGTLHLESTRPQAFAADDIAIATEVAASLAIAIRQVWLYERVQAELAERTQTERALREREQFLALLNDITRDALETPDLETMLQTLANRLAGLFGADGCYLTLWDEASETPVPAAAYGPWQDRFRSARAVPGETTMTASVLEAGCPLVVEDIFDTPYLDRRLAELFPDRSLLGLPLIAGGQKLGVVLVAFNEPHIFGPDEIARGEQAAAQVALALAKAQLVETLQETIGELQAFNEELDAFAHTVAHDLKNPVSTIVGYAELLEHEYASSSDELLNEFVPVIRQQAHKMGAIIDGLLLLSSVRGMQDIEICPLDMGAIVAEALSRMSASIVELEATVILPDTWPSALGYPPWIEEVWTNYLSNALKYGGRPPRIQLGSDLPPTNDDGRPEPVFPSTLRPEAPAEALLTDEGEMVYIRFWIRDNGPGLSAKDQARIFTPFERLRQVQASGQGLGLSIVQRIIHRLGGQVGVESQGPDGEGSTFYFTLPASPPTF